MWRFDPGRLGVLGWITVLSYFVAAALSGVAPSDDA